MKESFEYEMHLHTAEGSVCAPSTAQMHIRHAKELGLTGVFVTDHFFNSSSNRTDPSAPWETRVEQFFRGYEAAKEAGDACGVDVFFAFEYSYGWCHLLVYGLGKDWLLAHPDVCSWSTVEFLRKARADGGFVVHAHPFRERVEEVSLFPWLVDAVEVLNAARDEEHNRLAQEYARMLGLPQTAGSDYHRVTDRRHCTVISPERFTCVQDYVRLLRAGELELRDRTEEK